MNKSNLKRNFLVLFFLLLALTNTQNQKDLTTEEQELLKTKCDENKITYSIKINLKKYLDNDHNIDGREIYKTISDLKSKKIGICKGTYFDGSIEFDSIREYDNKDLLISAIKDFQIDGGIIMGGLADTIQEFSNIVSKFPEPLLNIDIVFGLQKDNNKTELKAQLNEFISTNKDIYKNLKTYWDLIWRESGFLNKTLTAEKGILKVIAKIDMSPHCYLRSYDQELIGAEIDFIYRFAREYGYGLSFIYAEVDDELLDALKQKKADIALGFFAKREDDTIDMTEVIYSSYISMLVRFLNLEESIDWTTLYGSIEEFNGEKLGIVKGSFYDTLSENYFPDSDFVYGDNIFDLIEKLMLEEINGFIYDQPVIEFYSNLFPHRVQFYTFDELEQNHNGFGFQKNEEGEALAKEFNEFLKTIDIPALEKKWNKPDWSTETMSLNDNSDLKIDKELNPDDKLLTVGFDLGLKPLSFYYGNEPMGLEIEIIYLFAKAKHYNINLIEINLEERIAFLKEKKVNITGGSFSITDERKNDIIFSDTIYSCGTVLAVRLDSKKDKIPIEIRDRKYNISATNIVNVEVKFPEDKIKTSACVFPDFYNDTILINCTIYNIQNVNTSKGFEYVNTEDKLVLLYNYIEANNLLQANTIIEGNNDIIQESDKSEEIFCKTSNSNTIVVVAAAASVAISLMVLVLRLCL